MSYEIYVSVCICAYVQAHVNVKIMLLKTVPYYILISYYQQYQECQKHEHIVHIYM
jgi:hypothetical protein